MKLQLWLVNESERARLYSKTRQGDNPVWVPRSVILRQTKHPQTEHENHPRCEVEIEDWFAEQKGLA